MSGADSVNILLVDDQPAKLLSYETILSDLGENLIKASSAREAFEWLLKTDVAVLLVDVCMPELDGFELARLVREHPRFRRTAIIFISAVQLADEDRLRAYEMGAVDYVPVPVIPAVLRAKVKVFVELYRKTRQLEELNRELELRVAERTAELEASTSELLQSESRRNLALEAGQMGSWHWNLTDNICTWDPGQWLIFGCEPESFVVSHESVAALIHPEDWPRWQRWFESLNTEPKSFKTEFRVIRPDGTIRWCIGSAASSLEMPENKVCVSGITIDITERKEAEERQALLAREVDHRAKNALAVVQSIIRLTHANTIHEYVEAVEGRITALSRAHTLLAHTRWLGADLITLTEDELAPYRTGPGRITIHGPEITLRQPAPQAFALGLHELATNAAKYGSLSVHTGKVSLSWELASDGGLSIKWIETGGPSVNMPRRRGFGLTVISSSIERQLGGRVEFDWRPQGLACTMTIPRDKVSAPQHLRLDSIVASLQRPEIHEPAPIRGGRVLLVEDEALVSLMTAEFLSEIGYTVLGPYRTVSEALNDATNAPLDAAVLDVNLGGEFIYPVARLLADRKIPIIFLTGYWMESIEKQYSQYPVLNKPIQLDDLKNTLGALTDTNRSTRLPKAESVSAAE